MSQLDAAVAAIRSRRPIRPLAFTGAGISADSGIPTFRGSDGLWENFRAEDLATPQAFARDPQLVWRWYEWRRDIIRNATPNAAHQAIAGAGMPVVTQNVDGLHARAGSGRVVELHGNIFRTRCVRERTSREAAAAFDSIPPRCECGALLRPDVVWFGEMLSSDDLDAAIQLIADSDLLLIVGTSGVVQPAAGLVALCRGLKVEVNPAGAAASGLDSIVVPMRGSEAVPALVEALS